MKQAQVEAKRKADARKEQLKERKKNGQIAPSDEDGEGDDGSAPSHSRMGSPHGQDGNEVREMGEGEWVDSPHGAADGGEGVAGGKAGAGLSCEADSSAGVPTVRANVASNAPHVAPTPRTPCSCTPPCELRRVARTRTIWPRLPTRTIWPLWPRLPALAAACRACRACHACHACRACRVLVPPRERSLHTTLPHAAASLSLSHSLSHLPAPPLTSSDRSLPSPWAWPSPPPPTGLALTRLRRPRRAKPRAGCNEPGFPGRRVDRRRSLSKKAQLALSGRRTANAGACGGAAAEEATAPARQGQPWLIALALTAIAILRRGREGARSTAAWARARALPAARCAAWRTHGG